jgi:hypothetical protein
LHHTREKAKERNKKSPLQTIALGFLAPLVFLPYLRFFLGREIVGNVEGCSDFFGLLKKEKQVSMSIYI